jgi:predicted ATP-dependent endonuclease of OLD family
VYLKELRVQNWRALVDVRLELAPGLNLVCGPNESGKSSLREAIRTVFRIE